ncbi:MAG TPA: hypothetical protein VFU21_21765 [Kofleriaceae bacterium]|nr:hypothetical protein [Kofleriaceae bacterium]
MKTSSRIAFLALFIAACAGHSPEVRMVGSPDVPAAEGVVRATAGEHGNTQLRIFVRHLARPEKVRPDATTYVVWLQPPGEPPQNMGALKVDEDLRGSLTTVTPLRTFDVFITLERSPTVRAPTARNVLSASIAR